MGQQIAIPAMAESIEQALQNHAPIGPAIEPFVRMESLPPKLRCPAKFSDAVGFEVHTWNRLPTYQRLPLDRIQMPPNDWLRKEEWWSSLFHEFMHATEWRTGWIRPLAIGELRAEIGQAILERLVGLPYSEDMTNYRTWHAKWLADLDAEPDAVLDAATAAVEGVELLVERALLERSFTPEDQLAEADLLSLLGGKREFAG